MEDRAHWTTLAKTKPGDVLEFVEACRGTRLALSMAIEALGLIAAPRAISLLFKYLEHEDALLRQGAALGLAQREDVGTIHDWLRKIAAVDGDEDVRQALEEFGE